MLMRTVEQKVSKNTQSMLLNLFLLIFLMSQITPPALTQHRTWDTPIYLSQLQVMAGSVRGSLLRE